MPLLAAPDTGRPAGSSMSSLPGWLEDAFGGATPARLAICAALVGVGGIALGLRSPGQPQLGVALLVASLIVLLTLAVRASLHHSQRAGAAVAAKAALRETIEALPAGVLLFDKDERLVLHNQAALRSSPALRQGARVGMSYSEIVEFSYARAAEAGAPLPGTPADWIARFRSKGQQVRRQMIGARWYEWSERPTASGGTVALRTDITELIQREQETERVRNLLQRTLDALPAGVTLYDEHERLVIYNKASAAMNPKLDWPAAVGRSFGELSRDLLLAHGLSAEQAEAEAAKWVARFRSGGRAEIFHLGDGRWVAASEHAAEGGGTVGLRLDVSELKAREEELERSRNFLQETLDALPGGIAIYDRDERLVTANKAAISINPELTRAVGRTFEELSWELRRTAGQTGKALEDGVRRAVARFRGQGKPDVFRVADGRWIEASEYTTASGYTVGLRRDVSELRASQEKIVQARDFLQETLDALPAGVELYDAEERLTVVNRAAIDISCGLLTAESIGKTFTELAHEAERMQTPDTPEPVSAEARIQRFRTKGARHVRRAPDGRWIERFEQATPAGGTIGLRVDVTDLKKRELEIERTRALLQETLDALPAGVTLWDRDERLVMFNEVAATINPRIREPHQIGRTFGAIVGELVAEIEKAGLAAPPDWLSKFRSRGEKRVMQAPDGRWFEWSERETKSGHTVGLRTDVSELVQRGQELERSRAEYRSIVESSGASMVLVDRNLDIVMANQEFWQSTGFVPEDTIGKPFLHKVDSSIDPLVLKGWLSGPLTKEQMKPVQYTKRRPDPTGRERVLSVTATPVVDADRMLQQIVFLAVDDTERRDAEQLLVDTERLATVGEMASTVAHEIAQPLQVINIAGASASAELEQARADGTTPDVEFIASKLERIADQVERASRIMGDLRSFVRGSASDAATSFDPADAIKSAVDLTRHGAQLARIEMRVEIDGVLPMVTGHLTRLEQVLVNLINNARDAGAKEIDLSAGEVIHEGRSMLRIVVDDAG